MIHLFYRYLWSNLENYSRSAGICAGLFLEGLAKGSGARINLAPDPGLGLYYRPAWMSPVFLMRTGI